MNQQKYSGTTPSVTVRDVLEIIWRRSWIILILMIASVGTAYYVSKNTPPRWKATAKLLIVPRLSSASGNAGSVPIYAPPTEGTGTMVALLTSQDMALRTLNRLKNDALSKGKDATPYYRISYEELQQAVTATPIKDTELIDVSVEADGRERAIEIANAMCQVFSEYEKSMATQQLEETSKAVTDRLEAARTQMMEADQAELAFTQNNKRIDITAETQAQLQDYMRRDQDVTHTKETLEADVRRVAALAAQLKETNTAITSGGGLRDDSRVTMLQGQLDGLQTKRSNLLLRYTEQWPEVRDLDRQITGVREQLTKAISEVLDSRRPTLAGQMAQFDDYKKAQMDVVVARSNLSAAIRFRDQVKNEVSSIPQVTMSYMRVKQKADVNRSIFNALQKAVSELNINKDLTTSSVQVIGEAEAPELRFKPNRLKDVGIGGGVGVFLCLLSVLLLEQADRRIRGVEAVRRIVPGPIIGMLPKMSRGDMRRMTHGEPPPHAIESYNIARANLALAVASDGRSLLNNGHIILVTSSVPGEGKSVTALEMARSIARSGKAVILIDADLRRPSINRLMRTNEPVGLADVLMGDVDLENALVSTDIDSLAVLHAGAAPGSPTDLISLPEMSQMLAVMKKEADVIVIDSPACSLFADSLLLAPHADCILHVVSSGSVDDDIVQSTANALGVAAPKTMVFFVNRAPKRSGRAYGYGYGYKYTREGSTNGVAHVPVPLNGRPAGDIVESAEETQPIGSKDP